MPRNHLDVKELSRAVAQQGEEAVIRPRDPATNLKAKPAGSGTVRLTWEASKDPAVVGYIVRYGPESNSHAHHKFVAKATSTEIKRLKSRL